MIRYNNNTQTFPPNWCQNLDRVKTIAELTRLSALGASDSFFDPSSIISPSSYIQHSTSVIRICLSLYLCHSHCPYQTVANVEIYVQQSALHTLQSKKPKPVKYHLFIQSILGEGISQSNILFLDFKFVSEKSKEKFVNFLSVRKTASYIKSILHIMLKI